jgi:hypothetical protein
MKPDRHYRDQRISGLNSGRTEMGKELLQFAQKMFCREDGRAAHALILHSFFKRSTFQKLLKRLSQAKRLSKISISMNINFITDSRYDVKTGMKKKEKEKH